MKLMTQEQITTIRTNAANTDMAKARKSGGIVITGTRIGNLDLSYDAIKKEYKLVDFNTAPGKAPCVWAIGAAKRVRPVLAESYIVVVS